MKQYSLFLIMALSFSSTFAQLKTKEKCAEFVIDILDGTVNALKPNVNPEEIKVKLNCFTSVEEENASSKCGGLIAYKDRDIYFYTGRDYVEIKEKFQGKLTLPLMGAKRNTLFKWLGNPKIKDVNWEAYQVQYGTLVIHFNAAQKVNKIQFSTKHSDFLSLCE